MIEIKEWDEIEKELGSDISQFNDWLIETEDITIFVTGIYERDLEEFRNEIKRTNKETNRTNQ